MGPFFPPSASLWQCLKDQISSFKAKTIYIFRHQNPQSLKALLSVFTIISGTFPPATINYISLSIIKLILLILATNSKRPLNQASLDALKLKLLMCNRWLMLTCCYYLPTKELYEKSFKSLLDTKQRWKKCIAKPGPSKQKCNFTYFSTCFNLFTWPDFNSKSPTFCGIFCHILIWLHKIQSQVDFVLPTCRSCKAIRQLCLQIIKQSLHSSLKHFLSQRLSKTWSVLNEINRQRSVSLMTAENSNHPGTKTIF